MEIRRSHVHREREHNNRADDNNASAELVAFVSTFDVAFPEDISAALRSASTRNPRPIAASFTSSHSARYFRLDPRNPADQRGIDDYYVTNTNNG